MDKDKHVILRYWSPVVCRSPFSVRVEGYIVDERTAKSDDRKPYRSSKIVESIEPRELVTKSGTVYYLDGPVYKEECRNKKFPDRIIEAFETGFPRDYENIMRRWLNPGAGPAGRSTAPHRNEYRPTFHNKESTRTSFRLDDSIRFHHEDSVRRPTFHNESAGRPTIQKNESVRSRTIQKNESVRRPVVSQVDDWDDDDLDATFDPLKERRQRVADSDDEVEQEQQAAPAKAKVKTEKNAKNKKQQNDTKDKEHLTIDHITAKKGTAKYKVQTDQFVRNFLTGGDVDNEEFQFIPETEAADRVADDFNLSVDMTNDASFMEAIRAPRPSSIIRPNKRKLMQQSVFRLDDSIDDFGEDDKQQEEETIGNDENDDGRREQVIRYLHVLQKQKPKAPAKPCPKRKPLNSAVLQQIDDFARRDASAHGQNQNEAQSDAEKSEEDLNDGWSDDE